MSVEWVKPSSSTWPRGVQALTTTRGRPGGSGSGLWGWNLADHVGDDPAAVADNRRLLAERSGVAQVQWLNQVHGTRCIEARSDTVGFVPEADAVWTSERGLGIAVLTADCVPVVVCNREGSVLGVAHGGWRGLVSGVLDSLLTALPAPPGNLVAWLGPAIGPDAYQVGDDVAEAVAAMPEGADCLRPEGHHHYYLDLFALTEGLLRRAGVEHVISERRCTYSDPRFYSYRRDSRTGRMATLAWLSRPFTTGSP